MNERQERLLVWCWECHGLTAREVDELGQPGDAALLYDLAAQGFLRRDHERWFPGVVN